MSDEEVDQGGAGQTAGTGDGVQETTPTRTSHRVRYLVAALVVIIAAAGGVRRRTGTRGCGPL